MDVEFTSNGGRNLKYKLFVLIAVMLLLITPAFGAISEYEASETAAKYLHDGETVVAHGPYTYMSQPYYYIEFRTGNTKTGVMFIDGTYNEPITDKATEEKIAYTHYALKNLDSASLTQIEQASSELQNFKAMIKNLNSYVNENKQAIASLDSSEQNKINDTVNALNKMDNPTTVLADKFDEYVVIGKDVLNGNKSYDNAKKIMDMTNGMSKNLDEFILVAKELSSTNEELGMSDRLIQFEVVSDELKELDQNTENTISEDVKSAESRKKPVPGFGLLFTVCSILIVGVLIKRRK